MHLRGEAGRIQGLIAVLMKPRNGVAWTREDREFLGREFRRLGRAAPAFIIFLLPGGVLLLPLYAWFLDARREARSAAAGAPSPN